MEKNSIHPLLKDRYSPLGFNEKEISENQVELLLQAASWAPSAFNDQPWRFGWVLKNDTGFKKVLSSFNDYNKQWARSSAAIIVFLHKNNYEHNGKPNIYATYDTGASVMSLIVQAMYAGIYAHQLAGFDNDILRGMLDIDDSLSIKACVALGFPADKETLDSPFKERAMLERQRKSVSEISFRIE